MIFALFGLGWLLDLSEEAAFDRTHFDPTGRLVRTVAAAVGLDLILAGSEIVHKVRLHFVIKEKRERENQAKEMEMQELQRAAKEKQQN